MTSLQKIKRKRIAKGQKGATAMHLWRMQPILPDGRRASIRLGAQTEKAARKIGSHIDHLVRSRKNGTRVDEETLGWLQSTKASLVKKLAKLGLCEEINNPTVVDFVAKFIAEKEISSAERTIINFRQLEKLLIRYFPNKRMSEVTRSDAMDFWAWLRQSTGLGDNSARRFFGRTREIFTDAVERDILTRNVFITKKIKVSVGAAAKDYIPASVIEAVIEHLPADNIEWKLLFAFARYVGCRVPSEIEQLTWADVNRERETILIKSPKTKRFEGKAQRLVPVFPEVAGLLSQQYVAVEPGEVYVFPTLRSHTNLATQAKRFVTDAGFVPWSCFWTALRASRETDLMDSDGPAKACEWIGNSLAVAAKHYQLVRKSSYTGVAQKSDSQAGAEGARTGENGQEVEAKTPVKTRVLATSSTPGENRTNRQSVGLPGNSDQSDAESDAEQIKRLLSEATPDLLSKVLAMLKGALVND